MYVNQGLSWQGENDQQISVLSYDDRLIARCEVVIVMVVIAMSRNGACVVRVHLRVQFIYRVCMQVGRLC